MKHTSKNLKNSKYELDVVLDQKEFLEYYQPIYDKALSETHLKGFRPGTAPKEMAEQAVNKEKVFEEAVHKAVSSTLKTVAEENDWQLIDQPKIEVLPSLDSPSLSRRGGESPTGLKYKAIITVFPEVKLGDYKKTVKKIIDAEKKEIKIEEKEIADTLKWILNSRAKLIRVNKIAEKGDVLDIDFAGFSEGKALDGTSGKADSFVLGDGKFIPGFEENLLGRKGGDEAEFTVTFPNDYWKEDMRNKKVDFKVKVHGVFKRELPELTDEFAKTLGKFENAEELKKNIREGMLKEKTEKENERVRLKLMDQIIKIAELDLPEIMLNKTLDGMVQEYKNYSAVSYKNGDKKTEESETEIRKKLDDKARNSVATNLVLYQIAKDEHLEPAREEVEEDVNKFLRSMRPEQAKNVDPQKLYDYSYGVVQNRKVFEFLESLK